MSSLDPDRTLALAYVPARHREAIRALWHLDAALGAVLTTAREPMIRQIRLAWWREALERLDTAPAPAEPVLRDLETHVLPAISGTELSGLEEGWRALLAETLDGPALHLYAAGRGERLFRLTARILGVPDHPVVTSGRVWALTDLARNMQDESERERAIAAAVAGPITRVPKSLRPLGMLARLADRDLRSGFPFEPQGAPRRMLVMAAHRLTGR